MPDDGITACKYKSKIDDFMNELKDLGAEEEDIKKQPDGSIHMTQTGLIDRILEDLGLTDSATIKHVPAIQRFMVLTMIWRHYEATSTIDLYTAN